MGPLLEAEGLKMYYASEYHNKIKRLVHMVKSIVSLRSKIDLVLIDTYSTQNFYYALITSQMCRFFNIPYVPILHGGNLDLRLRHSSGMSKKIFRNAKVNVAPSNYMKQVFNSSGYSNVLYIPNVLELQKYQLTSKKFDYPRVLWVRSFAEIYNPKLAILTLEKLKAIYPNAELCMIGPDSDGSLSEIQRLSQELGVQVKITGKLSKTEWMEMAKTYNVFINTSNFDNMPVSVIEAMALGLPIISTEVGGMSSLIDHNTDGILVPKNDPIAMSKAIQETFENVNKTVNRIKNARHKAEQFDWVKVRIKWLDVLKINVASN
ncbi:MAG: glycosyltransferase family 4 protein [Psychroserpens sp.]|nr:glycosyltransferase family 4 protein [Psychroserpens sp.]